MSVNLVLFLGPDNVSSDSEPELLSLFFLLIFKHMKEKCVSKSIMMKLSHKLQMLIFLNCCFNKISISQPTAPSNQQYLLYKIVPAAKKKFKIGNLFRDFASYCISLGLWHHFVPYFKITLEKPKKKKDFISYVYIQVHDN